MNAGKLFFVESVYSKIGKGYQKSAIGDQQTGKCDEEENFSVLRWRGCE
jgi:hypothetical protein